jgi:hypothetical protein
MFLFIILKFKKDEIFKLPALTNIEIMMSQNQNESSTKN